MGCSDCDCASMMSSRLARRIRRMTASYQFFGDLHRSRPITTIHNHENQPLSSRNAPFSLTPPATLKTSKTPCAANQLSTVPSPSAAAKNVKLPNETTMTAWPPPAMKKREIVELRNERAPQGRKSPVGESPT